MDNSKSQGPMSSPAIPFALFVVIASLISPSLSQTCSSQKFTNNNVYTRCSDLPALKSFLHWRYDADNSTLYIAFVAPPDKPDGWIAWAINPNDVGMVGAQTLFAFKNSKGEMVVKTYDISSYSSIKESSKLWFDVKEAAAEFSGGLMRLFATLVLPEKGKTTLNHVWQVGASVTNGFPAKHNFQPANLNSKGTLDLLSGESKTDASGDSKVKKKNIHGILNAISWGMLFPIGIIIARYLRTFPSADSAWFYLHVSCQCSAYVIGVAGWATGLKLGSESKGITYHVHRNIGITFSVLQHCRKAVHGIFSRIGLFKVILRRRHLLYCHACFLKFEVRDNGLDGLGQIIGINLLYTGSLRSFKRRATRQRQLESPRRVAHCTRVVWCLWGQEASLGRPATREEVWKKIHMKIRDGKEVWVETRAGYTYDRYDQAIEELKKNRSIDDQGNPIMLSEEETLSCWLDVVGGVYKGRTYYLCSEKNFHRL